MTQRKGITESGPRLKAMNDALERDRLRLTDAEWKLYGKRIFFDTYRERIERIDGMERHIKGTGEQGFHMQGDLVQRLRDRAYGSKIPDPLVEEAADEIERLRPAYATAVQRLASEITRLRLTDEERAAVEWAANAADPYYTGHTATLRGLLERLA